MHKSLCLLVLVIFVGLPLMAQTPPNDSIGSATVIAALPFSDQVSTLNATTDPNPNDACWGTMIYNSVWYTITPDTDAKMEFNTLGSNFDTSMAVYSDPNGYPITCNADADGDLARIRLDMSAGTTYYIGIGSQDWLNPGGDLHFYAGVVTPPANDDISTAVIVGSLPFTYTESAFAATVSPTDPTPSCDMLGGESVWFVYDATYNGSLDIDTTNTSYQTITAVYTGLPGALTEIACRQVLPHLILPVTAGTRYYVVIEAYAGWVLQGALGVTFAVGPPAFEFTVTKLTGTVSPSDGMITISGVATCTRASSFSLFGPVTQKEGQSLAIAYFYTSGYCEPGTDKTWSFSGGSWGNRHAGRSFTVFRGGKVGVSLAVESYDLVYGDSLSRRIETTVPLKAGPAPK
jgi:hypothetical protein